MFKLLTFYKRRTYSKMKSGGFTELCLYICLYFWINWVDKFGLMAIIGHMVFGHPVIIYSVFRFWSNVPVTN